MVMTSRPPPRTSRTLLRPSVRTSRNSMSVCQKLRGKLWHLHESSTVIQVTSLSESFKSDRQLFFYLEEERIQFSSPVRFLGGPGMFSRTSFASCDFFTMTSLSFCAWCMRLTFDWFLYKTSYEEHCKDFFVNVRFLYMTTFLAYFCLSERYEVYIHMW